MLCSGIRTFTGPDRSQTLLLPAAIEDYVGADNLVRFIDAFVDQLSLAELGFVSARPERTGRPSYHPGDLLKRFIYGYLNRVRSSRRLEAETHRNREVIWLRASFAMISKPLPISAGRTARRSSRSSESLSFCAGTLTSTDAN